MFPAVSRDLNILLDDGIPWSRVEATIHAVGLAELERLAYLSTYTKGLPPRRKALAFSMTFRRCDATLTTEQVNAFQSAILQALSRELGAQLRT